METVVAVIDPVFDLVLDLPDAADPVVVTQSPTARVEAGTVTVWLKVVVGLQLTVTCPLVGFWTSIEVPDRAASVPDAAVGAGPEVAAPAAPAPMSRPRANARPIGARRHREADRRPRLD
jgi:hypothetical protein